MRIKRKGSERGLVFMAKEKKKDQKAVKEVVERIEKALYAVRFYPVAVDGDSKEKALERLRHEYAKGNDTIKQMLLYLVHEALAKTYEFRVMHTQEFLKMKKPDTDPAQLRMGVYRAIFNYNTSLEGACELYRLLGSLKADDASKLLTYHYSRLCAVENEGHHILRAAVIEALGISESRYALDALLEYARYTDSDRSLNRIVAALFEWERKLDKMRIKPKERERIRERLHETITKETGGTHYG